MIYLDYQSTTPLAPEARAAMIDWLSEDGSANPHSAHVAGRRARAAVDVARAQVMALLPPGGKLYFTSGATEAANWALRCVGARSIGVLATEHAAVLDTARAMRPDVTVTEVPVGHDGLVEPSSIPAGLDLLAVMLVNNEIGVVQPIAQLVGRASLLFCDAVQGYGRVAIPPGCDMIAISAHKIYGPKGIGALWVRDGVALEPLLHGGGQEGGIRSGTLSPALCVGFGIAAGLAATRMADDSAHVAELWEAARRAFGEGWTVNGSVDARWHGNLNLRRAGLDVARLMSDLRDIAFSAGSACASGSGRASHVLRAIGLSEADARSSIRLGFGRGISKVALLAAVERIAAAADSQAVRAA